MKENIVDGRRYFIGVFRCFRTMETFQNRPEGINVGEENGELLILADVADQVAELLNRRHMRSKVIDDEILNFFRLKERTKRWIDAEEEEKHQNRVGGFGVDDETLLSDEKMSNFSNEIFSYSRKRTDGGVELRGSRSVSKRRDKGIHFFFVKKKRNH